MSLAPISLRLRRTDRGGGRHAPVGERPANRVLVRVPQVAWQYMRPYTGINDGIAKGARPGLLVLVDYIAKSTQGMLWNNGTYANRKARGKSSMSVHATGRAADLSYRQITRQRWGKGRPHAVHVMRWLTANSEAFGLEMILDYMPQPHGRGWRCDRNAWENYKKKTQSAKPWHLLNPDSHIDENEANRRFEICKLCPRLIQATKQCKECGCFMNMKVKLKTAVCPIGKW